MQTQDALSTFHKIERALWQTFGQIRSGYSIEDHTQDESWALVDDEITWMDPEGEECYVEINPDDISRNSTHLLVVSGDDCTALIFSLVNERDDSDKANDND